MKERFHKLFDRYEEAVGVVEMVLILAVLLGLVVIFRTQLTRMVGNIFSSITDTVNSLI